MNQVSESPALSCMVLGKSLTLILRFLILVKKRHIIVTQQGGVKIVFKLLRNGTM